MIDIGDRASILYQRDMFGFALTSGRKKRSALMDSLVILRSFLFLDCTSPLI